jgi:uncharacterized DUF497 family protein
VRGGEGAPDLGFADSPQATRCRPSGFEIIATPNYAELVAGWPHACRGAGLVLTLDLDRGLCNLAEQVAGKSRMRVLGTIWLREVVDKLDWKHDVATEEVEEVFSLAPHYRHIERGDLEGEDLYAAFGQTQAGRYLTVFFVYKKTKEALVISARDSTRREKRTYARQNT